MKPASNDGIIQKRPPIKDGFKPVFNENIRYHLVFTIQNRKPSITEDVLQLLNLHFREKAEKLGVRIYIMNGYRDHVHLLISSPPKSSISDIVRHLKGYSSYCIKELHWQRGYAVFSVDTYSFNRIYGYIRNQGKHYR